MKRKFSGKRYFYWMGGADCRNFKTISSHKDAASWPKWALIAHSHGYCDQFYSVKK